jgi:hypothetical protein
MAMQFIGLVAKMSEDTFADVIQSSPRKIRETLFARLGIKAKKTVGLKVHGKLEDRTKKLHERLRGATTKQEDDLCMELVRNWLYTQRPLLKATLDHLGVKNDNGLVDEEPTFFEEMTAEKRTELVDALKAQGFTADAIAIYLTFMKVPGAAEIV